MNLHRRYYASSVVNSLLFYGTVVLVCLLFNVLVALVIVVFFMRFYRREILFALKHPVLAVFRPAPPGGDKYRFECLPPGSTAGKTGP